MSILRLVKGQAPSIYDMVRTGAYTSGEGRYELGPSSVVSPTAPYTPLVDNPVVTPTPTVTPTPSVAPTETPTPGVSPTGYPTLTPTVAPTATPGVSPMPTDAPTASPTTTPSPTAYPTIPATSGKYIPYEYASAYRDNIDNLIKSTPTPSMKTPYEYASLYRDSINRPPKATQEQLNYALGIDPKKKGFPTELDAPHTTHDEVVVKTERLIASLTLTKEQTDALLKIAHDYGDNPGGAMKANEIMGMILEQALFDHVLNSGKSIDEAKRFSHDVYAYLWNSDLSREETNLAVFAQNTANAFFLRAPEILEKSSKEAIQQGQAMAPVAAEAGTITGNLMQMPFLGAGLGRAAIGMGMKAGLARYIVAGVTGGVMTAMNGIADEMPVGEILRDTAISSATWMLGAGASGWVTKIAGRIMPPVILNKWLNLMSLGLKEAASATAFTAGQIVPQELANLLFKGKSEYVNNPTLLLNDIAQNVIFSLLSSHQEWTQNRQIAEAVKKFSDAKAGGNREAILHSLENLSRISEGIAPELSMYAKAAREQMLAPTPDIKTEVKTEIEKARKGKKNEKAAEAPQEGNQSGRMQDEPAQMQKGKEEVVAPVTIKARESVADSPFPVKKELGKEELDFIQKLSDDGILLEDMSYVIQSPENILVFTGMVDKSGNFIVYRTDGKKASLPIEVLREMKNGGEFVITHDISRLPSSQTAPTESRSSSHAPAETPGAAPLRFDQTNDRDAISARREYLSAKLRDTGKYSEDYIKSVVGRDIKREINIANKSGIPWYLRDSGTPGSEPPEQTVGSKKPEASSNPRAHGLEAERNPSVSATIKRNGKTITSRTLSEETLKASPIKSQKEADIVDSLVEKYGKMTGDSLDVEQARLEDLASKKETGDMLGGLVDPMTSIRVNLQLFALKEARRMIDNTNIPYETEFGKTSKHPATMWKDNKVTPAQRTRMEKMAEQGKYAYEKMSLTKEGQKAIAKVRGNLDAAFGEWMSKFEGDVRLTPEDSALAKVLEYELLRRNDPRWEAVSTTYADALTKNGQFIAAAKILQDVSPEGYLSHVEKWVDRFNKDLEKKWGDKGVEKKVAITDEEAQRILNAEDPNARAAIGQEIENRIKESVPKSLLVHLDSWRMVSMLLNPVTHIRNIVGNAVMLGLRKSADFGAALGEYVLMRGERAQYRQKELFPSKEQMKLAREDWKTVEPELMHGSDKYEIATNQHLSKNPFAKVIDKLGNITGYALNMEDVWFLRPAYRKELGRILKAKGVTSADGITTEMREAAAEYAMEATFRQANEVAKALNKAKAMSGPIFVKRNGRYSMLEAGKNLGKNIVSLFLRAEAPFVKTPLNLFKTGIDYSAIGGVAGAIELLGSRASTKQVISDFKKAGRVLTPEEVKALRKDARKAIQPSIDEAVNAAKKEGKSEAEVADIEAAAKKDAWKKYAKQIEDISTKAAPTKGEIEAELATRAKELSDGIHKISKGATGTGVAILGAWLASMGIISGPPDNDADRAAYEKAVGDAPYALHIGNNYVTIDWMQPAIVPLSVGIMINEELENKGLSFDNVLTALGKGEDVLFNLPMLTSISRSIAALSDKNNGGVNNALSTFGVSVMDNYMRSMIPTIFGKTASIVDRNLRSQYTPDTGLIPKALEAYKKYIFSRIPGVSKTLEPKVDMWGRDMTQASDTGAAGVGERIAENLLIPGIVYKQNSNDVDVELKRLYEAMKDPAVFPHTLTASDGKLTINGKSYVMSEKEYTQYQRDLGQTALNLLSDIIKTDAYKNASDEDKVATLKSVYSYTLDVAKYTLRTNRGETVPAPTDPQVFADKLVNGLSDTPSVKNPITWNKQTYSMTDAQNAEYKKNKADYTNEWQKKVMASSLYQTADSDKKQKLLEAAVTYATSLAQSEALQNYFGVRALVKKPTLIRNIA